MARRVEAVEVVDEGLVQDGGLLGLEAAPVVAAPRSLDVRPWCVGSTSTSVTVPFFFRTAPRGPLSLEITTVEARAACR